MDYRINQFEQTALKGLPHLPRLVYLELRPHMDYSTGFVGIKRGVSYQSLREELYVEPHQGYASGSPSKDQIRRAIKTLERAELISIHSESKKLIVKCELATWDYCEQNKVATKAPHQVATKTPFKNSDKTSTFEVETVKATTAEFAKAATPPVSGINNIFVCDAFEKFWQLYPVKQSKPKAWHVFQNLAPTEQLINQMIDALEKQIAYRADAAAQGHWMPNWKHAANWLMQCGWEDELSEKVNASSATSKTNKSTKQSGDALWDYCKDAFTEEHSESNNVINLFKQRQRAY